MANNGWIKLYRSLLDNPIVCKDTEYFTIWAYILLKATRQDTPAIFKGEKITLKPGQLLIGRQAISNHFGGKSSLSESKVQRVLKTLEIEQQIEQQTSNKNRLITVINWELYQDNEQQIEQRVNNQRTTTEQQLNTNKNIRSKEVKEEVLKECVKPSHPPLQEIIDFCNQNKFIMDPEQFYNYEESKGWKVGNIPMKDWKAACRNWEKREKDFIKERKNNGNGKQAKPEVTIDWLNQYIETQN